MLKIDKNNFKLSLCESISLNHPLEIDDNDPIFKLISFYKEIENIIQYKKEKASKFLYFNKINVHKILYDSENVIKFISEMLEYNLSNYFYLIALLDYNTNIVNYDYSKEEIKTINKIKR